MSAATAERRVLDEAGGLGATIGIMAIMMFLTVLAAATGLGTAAAAHLLGRDLAGRATVQLATGDPAPVVAALRGDPAVARVVPVDRAELARLLRPWLGADGADPALPMPTLIDVSLRDVDEAGLARLADRVRRVAPVARIDRDQAWMSPVSGLLRSVVWLAGGLVLLMAGATAAVVVLAARAGLQTHRATIEVMHMLGATDRQVARLFQRRIALDAAIGGTIGAVAALAVAAALQVQLAALGSELLGGAALGPGDWLLLALLPVGFVGLATLAARVSVMRVLRHIL